MARAATTSDAFNAVAEPRRREILNYLALQEAAGGGDCGLAGAGATLGFQSTCAFCSRWALSTYAATAGGCCIEPMPRPSGRFTSGRKRSSATGVIN